MDFQVSIKCDATMGISVELGKTITKRLKEALISVGTSPSYISNVKVDVGITVYQGDALEAIRIIRKTYPTAEIRDSA